MKISLRMWGAHARVPGRCVFACQNDTMRGSVAHTWVVAAGGGHSGRGGPSAQLCHKRRTATRWRKRHAYRGDTHSGGGFDQHFYTSVSSNPECILHAADANDPISSPAV